MILPNSDQKEETLNIFVLTSVTPKINEPLSYTNIIKACQSLLRDLINTEHQELVYTFEHKRTPIKIWNGSGIEIGSQVMRLGCRKKDIVIVIKSKASQKLKSRLSTQIKRPKTVIEDFRGSWQDETMGTDRTESQISEIIRKSNRDCVIGYVYLNDQNYLDNEEDIIQNPIVMNGIQMNVEPIVGKENQQFKIRIDKKGSAKSMEDNVVLTQMVDCMSSFYSNSHFGVESSVSRKLNRLSSIQRPTKKKQIPMKAFYIEDLFDFLSPKKRRLSKIKLKGISTYTHKTT